MMSTHAPALRSDMTFVTTRRITRPRGVMEQSFAADTRNKNNL
jgi:hypothetical protein